MLRNTFMYVNQVAKAALYKYDLSIYGRFVLPNADANYTVVKARTHISLDLLNLRLRAV